MKLRDTVWILMIALALCASVVHAQDQKLNSPSASPLSPVDSGGGSRPGTAPVGAARGISPASDPDPVSHAQLLPDNITLLPLPPYSPELNPMENVWHYLRENTLCSLVWDTYEDIVDACATAWHFLINDPQRIRSIGTRDWACVTI